MNEHRKRVHDAQGITADEFSLLETCQASKHAKHTPFRVVAPTIDQEDFRHESLFEMRVGLLKFSTIFYDGEERAMTMDCKKYFNQESPNPFYQQVLEFLETARSLCNSPGSDLVRQQALRNAEGAVTVTTFRPVEQGTVKKYARSVAELIFFATKCPWDHNTFDLTDVLTILNSVFFERQRSIQHNFMTRKFIQMSYCTFGCGPNSRNAQFIVHQCVGILYAMRVFYLHHCLKIVHPSRILEPSRISLSYLNSGVSSSFTAIQNIKRPGKLDIPEFGSQKITWSGLDFVSLHVHTGVLGLCRVPVSHTSLRDAYNRIISKIRDNLKKMGVEPINFEYFLKLRDSSSSTRAGEGLSIFNPDQVSNYHSEKDRREARLGFLSQASNLYRLALAAIHLTGGPSPRGTEDAVTRLLNSCTELVRNVQFVQGTIGVSSGYTFYNETTPY